MEDFEILKFIKNILEKNKIEQKCCPIFHEIYSKSFYDLNLREILQFFECFLYAFLNKSIEHLKIFISAVMIDKEYEHYEVLKCGNSIFNKIYNREDKICVEKFKKGFEYDFETLDGLRRVLSLLYIISIEELEFLNRVTNIVERDESKKMWIIETGYKKKDLGWSNKPSISLDKYASMVMEEMNRREQQSANEDTEEIDAPLTVHDLRKLDDTKDDNYNKSGRKKNMG